MQNPSQQGIPYSWTDKAKHITERTGEYGMPYSQTKLVAQDPATGRLGDPFVAEDGPAYVLGSVSGLSNHGPRYSSRPGFNISLAERQHAKKVGRMVSKFPKQMP